VYFQLFTTRDRLYWEQPITLKCNGDVSEFPPTTEWVMGLPKFYLLPIGFKIDPWLLTLWINIFLVLGSR